VLQGVKGDKGAPGTPGDKGEKVLSTYHFSSLLYSDYLKYHYLSLCHIFLSFICVFPGSLRTSWLSGGCRSHGSTCEYFKHTSRLCCYTKKQLTFLLYV